MSSSPMFLTKDEISELTKRFQHSAQLKILRAMGIEHRIRPDGSLVVLRSHIEQLLGDAAKVRKEKVTEPNWKALNASRS